MNIIDQLSFNADKPSTSLVRNTDNIKYIAVGLLQDQLLPDHTTALPTLLTVIKGKVEFTINGEKNVLDTYDTFQIPVNEMHHVRGIDEQNVFTLIMEK